MTSFPELKKAFKAAFPFTLPIFAGFWFIGLTYGIYMHSAGFSFWYPMLMSALIFAGSMEFITANLLLSVFDPVQAFILTIMVNSRHTFYGISMLEKYRNTGLKKIYLIFGLCDETFAVNYTAEPPAGVDKGWFMFFITLLNHFYWVSGSTLGGIFGTVLNFNTEGLDFVMPALFIVIFLEQWLKEKDHISGILGIFLCTVWLMITGPDRFLIPSIISILAVLTLFRRPLERRNPA